MRTSLREALWKHRGSLDALRDAICAFASDLNARGVSAADIAAAVRDTVFELRASGAPLAAELAEADPSLDQTVAWCLGFDAGSENPLPTAVTEAADRNTRRTSSSAEAGRDRRSGGDRRNPTRLRGP